MENYPFIKDIAAHLADKQLTLPKFMTRNEIKNRIECGDKVEVYFTSSPWFYGTVEYKPADTGDCWVVREDNGTLHYIQTFCEIVKRPLNKEDNYGNKI